MSTPTDNGWRTMLIVLAALLASVLIVTPQTTATRRR
jgi:hypothetical protein